MKKIVLLCAAGMSTSLLVNKMREASEGLSEQFEINAYPIADAQEQGKDADIILLGPQVRFQETKIKKLLPNKIVSSIDMKDYGMMNGLSVLNYAIKRIGE